MRRFGTLILVTLFFAATGIQSFAQKPSIEDARFISYVADPQKQDIKFYWKNEKNEIFRSILNLKNWLEQKDRKLVFAMNGGMYQEDNSPLGLFIENGRLVSGLNRRSGKGNFYMKPNGVFYITADNIAVIISPEGYAANRKVKQPRYATQSGPMLVINGKIHPDLKQGSANLNIRNGVGILPDGRVIFAMSKNAINFYDFADYFKRLGCKNALYLDGFVSRTYLPAKQWIQTDGNFGVIIGVTEPNNN